MTADEHDNPAASGAREATEIYPFSSGYPQQTGTARGPLPDWQAADQPLPELPVMEQLPDPEALPDPGYPTMPSTPPPVASQPLPAGRPSAGPIAADAAGGARAPAPAARPRSLDRQEASRRTEPPPLRATAGGATAPGPASD